MVSFQVLQDNSLRFRIMCILSGFFLGIFIFGDW